MMAWPASSTGQLTSRFAAILALSQMPLELGRLQLGAERGTSRYVPPEQGLRVHRLRAACADARASRARIAAVRLELTSEANIGRLVEVCEAAAG
jgi:hypothetical protein